MWNVRRYRGSETWVWVFKDKYRYSYSALSHCRWNPYTGVFQLLYNLTTEKRYSQVKSEKAVGKALKGLFNADKYICNVTKSCGSHRYADMMHTSICWTSRFDKAPTSDVMEKVEALIQASMVELMLVARVVSTGETETYTAMEAEREFPSILYMARHRRYRNSVIKGRRWKVV